MQPLGLQIPKANAAPAQQLNVGGVMSMKPLKTLLAEEATAAAIARAAQASNEPVVVGLAAMLHKHWTSAKSAKQAVEQEMLAAVRSRGGRYSADMESKLAAQGGSQIFMMLFATKARQAKALLGDILIGSGSEKAWTISPSPKPDLPQADVAQVMQGIHAEVMQAEMSGMPMSVEDIRLIMADSRDKLQAQLMEAARREAQRAEVMLEDCLVEGGDLDAVNEFLDDITVFKTAFIKGPIVRRMPVMKWESQGDGTSTPVVTESLKLTWERVDPFMIYPAGWSKSVDDAYLFERHRLSRADLTAMIGVEGYSEDAIRAALDQHGTGGLREWLSVDTAKDTAEGRDMETDSELMDALQYWGSVSGKMLREWGMKDITDDAKEYEVEVWMIGQHVIKAVINPDPLRRRPYYADGYSRIPGAFWHNSLYDLIQDCESMCNAAARALANNLGISSGPQVAINIDRMPAGEELTEMFPWKMWQFTNDTTGSSAAPISFFQPNSNAAELMGVYDKFSLMADEYSGIPRYMTGTEGTPGAGRTASGLSMMVGNASKVIRSLVSSIDIHITTPKLKRLFDHKMQFDPEADFKGDLQIVARGALSLQVKEVAQQARLQFLQSTANPIDMQIVGVEGRAAVLREVSKALNMDQDKVVPPLSILKARAAVAQQQQAAQQAQQVAAQQGEMVPGSASGKMLADGTPTTDTFSQPAQ
jgi:hypothetical protein